MITGGMCVTPSCDALPGFPGFPSKDGRSCVELRYPPGCSRTHAAGCLHAAAGARGRVHAPGRPSEVAVGNMARDRDSRVSRWIGRATDLARASGHCSAHHRRCCVGIRGGGRRQVTVARLRTRAEALWAPRRSGCAVILELLAARGPEVARAANLWEATVLRVVRRLDLPPPRVNHRVRVGGRVRVLDLAWPEAGRRVRRIRSPLDPSGL